MDSHQADFAPSGQIVLEKYHDESSRSSANSVVAESSCDDSTASSLAGGGGGGGEMGELKRERGSELSAGQAEQMFERDQQRVGMDFRAIAANLQEVSQQFDGRHGQERVAVADQHQLVGNHQLESNDTSNRQFNALSQPLANHEPVKVSQAQPAAVAPVSHQQQQQQQQHQRQQQHMKPPDQLDQQPTSEQRTTTAAAGVDYDEVQHVDLFGVKIVALIINNKERLCLAQISNTLLKDFSYNEIHNRRVALGITCVQCTPIQLEMLRRAGAMPSSSRRCGMITMREAERLCRSFLAEEQPPELPENFYFTVGHRVNYGCKGRFIPSRYISSRAKCIECFHCGEFFSPNKFIFHSHKHPDATDCNPPDSPNINSWRKHINLDWSLEHSQEIKYAWEDVKSLFNGGTRRRASISTLPGGGAGGGAAHADSNVAARRQRDTTTTSTTSQDNEEEGEEAEDNDADDVDDNDDGDEASRNSGSNTRAPAKRRKITQHNIEDLSAPSVGFGVAAKAGQRQQFSSPAAAPHHHHHHHQHHHLSQSERRKLPMGHWPTSAAPSRGSNGAAQQLSGGGGGGSSNSGRGSRLGGGGGSTRTMLTIPPVRRISPCNASERDPTKRLLTTTNWHQPRIFAAESKRQMGSPAPPTPPTPFSQPPTQQQHYGHEHNLNTATTYDERHGGRLAANLGHHINNQQQQQQSILMQKRPAAQLMGGDLQQSDLSLSKLMAGPTSCATPAQQQQQPQTSPSSFIYSQLYSHLMQSQLEQQQPCPPPPPQQQQYKAPSMTPIEAQLALRHHIWSSLLANLRCSPAGLDDPTLSAGLVDYNAITRGASNPLLSGSANFAANSSQSSLIGDVPANLNLMSAAHLGPSGFNPLNTMMQMYGAAQTAGQINGLGETTATTSLLSANQNDSCK